MNAPYSTSAWITSVRPPRLQTQTAIGTPRTSATRSWKRLFSQRCFVRDMRGNVAIAARSATNGRRPYQGTVIPTSCLRPAQTMHSPAA